MKKLTKTLWLRKYGFADWYSVQHFISGLVVGLILMCLSNEFIFLQATKYYFLTGFILLIIWEIFEVFTRIFKSTFQKTFFRYITHESYLNIVGDLIIGTLGLSIIHSIFHF